MTTISYILEIIICSGLFLVAYRWLLARKVSFGLCRAFILVSMLLAIAIPVMDIPVFPERKAAEKITFTGLDFLEESPAGVELADEGTEVITSGTEAAETVPAKKMTDIKAAAGIAVKVIYVLVALASLGLTGYNVIRINRLRRRSRLTHTEEYTLAEHEETTTPFSFLRTIFMGFNYEPEERRQILTHEASHVRHRHSFERLTLSVLRSVFWFNPFFWMAEKDLEEVQEWEADKDVLNEGYELDTYRTTIFKQLFGYNPDISCGLNHSLTKQRFIMMTQSHRGKGAWIRLAATLPVIAAVFVAFGCGTKEAKASDEVYTDLTNGTETTYLPMCPPCDATVSNSFSAGRAGLSHTGIDYVLNEGDPVYAAADGEISSITRDNSNGLMVTLKHADGIETRYAHLSKVNICTELSIESSVTKVNRTFQLVTDADHSDQIITGKLKKGQLIGYAGSTGRATGAHLHFEVRQNGKSIDPVPLFTSNKLTKAPLQIYVIKDGEISAVICNGKRIEISEIGQIVAEYFADGEIYNVAILADEDVQMGIITDIKEQLRTIKGLRITYTSKKTVTPDHPYAETVIDEYYKVETYKESRRNIIVLKTNAADRYFIGDRPGYLDDTDRERVKGYILNKDNNPDYPEKTDKEFTLPDGRTIIYPVSQAMILMQNDRGTSFEGYQAANAFVQRIYTELRNDLSDELFGRPLAELSDAEMSIIRQAIPMNVCEAEPKYAPQKK